MDQLITTDCPECHGEGSVPFFPDQPERLERRPCGTCLQRWDDANPPSVAARVANVLSYIEQPHLNDPHVLDLVEATLARQRSLRPPPASPRLVSLAAFVTRIADCDPVIRDGSGEDNECYFCGGRQPARSAQNADVVHWTKCAWLEAQALRAQLAAEAR